MGKQARERREKWAKVQEAREIEGLVKRAGFVNRVCRWSKAITDDYDSTSHYEIVNDLPISDMPFAYGVCDLLSDSTVIDASELIASECRKIPTDIFIPPSQVEGIPISVILDHLFIQWTLGESSSGVHLWLFEKTDNSGFYGEAFMLDTAWDDDIDYLGSADIEISGDSWSATIPEMGLGYITLARAMYVLRFLSAKNVILADAETEPSLDRQYHRCFGVPMLKYKQLAISVPRSHRRDDQPQITLDIMPLHMVRGHWQNSPDHPVVNFRGLHWKHPHLRGNEKNGIVVKDYKVKPPPPEFLPKKT